MQRNFIDMELWKRVILDYKVARWDVKPDRYMRRLIGRIKQK